MAVLQILGLVLDRAGKVFDALLETGLQLIGFYNGGDDESPLNQ